MDTKVLYALIGVLILALVVVGWLYVQERNSNRLEINLGNGGISVQSN